MEVKIQQYSIGFMFNDDMTEVLLLLKGHGPKCVIGRWNGIGGHFNLIPGTNEYETPVACQVREFHEETGVLTDESDWAKFTDLVGNDFKVHCFWGRNTKFVEAAKTTTEEEVAICFTHPKTIVQPLAPNLNWWIPFLCDTTTKNHLCVVLATYLKDDDLG